MWGVSEEEGIFEDYVLEGYGFQLNSVSGWTSPIKTGFGLFHYSQWKKTLLEVYSPSKGCQALIAWLLFGSEREISQQGALIFVFNALYLAAKQLTKHKIPKERVMLCLQNTVMCKASPCWYGCGDTAGSVSGESCEVVWNDISFAFYIFLHVMVCGSSSVAKQHPHRALGFLPPTNGKQQQKSLPVHWDEVKS